MEALWEAARPAASAARIEGEATTGEAATRETAAKAAALAHHGEENLGINAAHATAHAAAKHVGWVL